MRAVKRSIIFRGFIVYDHERITIMWLKTLSFVLTAVFVLSAAAMVPSFAQQAQNSTTDDNTIALPISAILDSVLSAHEQDIKDKIFQYKFNSANNSPAVQADLIVARSNELKKSADDNENLMNALMASNDTISGEQLAAIAEETNESMGKLDNLSKDLEKHSGEVSSRTDHKSYVDPVKPLMNNITNAKTAVMKISQAAKEKIAQNKKFTGNKYANGSKNVYGKS